MKPLSETLAYITTNIDENNTGYPKTVDGLDKYEGHHSLNAYSTTGDFCDYYMNYQFDEENPEDDWPSYPAITVELLSGVGQTDQLPLKDMERVVRANIASALYFIEYNIEMTSQEYRAFVIERKEYQKEIGALKLLMQDDDLE